MSALPGAVPVNDFDLVKAIDRLGQRIVVAVAPATHRRLDAVLGRALDVASVDIDDEGLVQETLPGRDIGEIGFPQLVRPGGDELPVYPVLRAWRRRVLACRPDRLAAQCAT